MKKLNLLFLLVAGFFAMTAIVSCTPETDDVKPTLGFIAEGASITADKTVDPLTPLLFKVSGAENPNTKKALQSIRVQSFIDNTPNVDTTVTINDDSYLGSFNYNATSFYSKEEKFTFTLTDKAGETATKTFIITTTEAAGNIKTFTNVILLGAQSNANGSYLDAYTADIYTSANYLANAASIDMIYFYGSTNLATLAAPSDVTVNGTGSNLALAVGMSPQNDTKFMTTTITTAEFDAMADDSSFPTITSGAGDSKANDLALNDVIAFETADGKKGLIKVTEIVVNANGTLKIDVKIQE